MDPNLQRKVTEALEAGPEDGVLEIGPGHGELTRHLVGRVRGLVLVEKDDALAHALAERWGDRDDVRLVHGDALEVDLAAELAGAWGSDGVRPYRALSNVPYGITSPLLFRLLELRPPPERMVLTVQREVAERLTAREGGRDYGALTVGVALRSRARMAFDVSRNAFRPRPGVDSATVVLVPRSDPPTREEMQAVRRLTRAAFGRRRKQLQKILRTAPVYSLERRRAESLCRELGVEPRVRPEKLSPRQFLELARRLERLRVPRQAEG